MVMPVALEKDASSAALTEMFAPIEKIITFYVQAFLNLPTLLDLCDIEIPESVDGQSMLSSKHEYIYGGMRGR